MKTLVSYQDNDSDLIRPPTNTLQQPIPVHLTILWETLVMAAQALFVGIGTSILLGFIIVIANPAQAQTLSPLESSTSYPEPENFKHINDVASGSLLTHTPSGEYTALPLLDTRVEMFISGLVNKTELQQTFKNTTADKIEATYVFPLPENAAVERFKLIIGEKVIEGKIKEKQQAKLIYQKAKRQGKHTALMTQQRPNIFTTKVANIEPNTDVTIWIDYQQQINYQSSGFEVRFPLVISPRYTPLDLNLYPPTQVLQENIILTSSDAPSYPTTQPAKYLHTNQHTKVEQSTELLNPIVSQQTKINPVMIKVHLDSGFPLQQVSSPSHQILTSPSIDLTSNENANPVSENGATEPKTPETSYEVTLANHQVPADRDFVLQWRLKKSHYPRAALFSEPDQEEQESHYINMMLMPPEQLFSQEQRLNKETVLVLDTSGSMHGISIQQAKQAVIKLLNQMSSGDSFNLVQFNNDYQYLFPNAVPVTTENIFKAIQYVQNLDADGGTEMANVMQSVLKAERKIPNHQRKQIRQVVFITDGSISNESQLFSIIQRDLGASRLFTVGIGAAPNSYFMRKAAEFGRGTFTYISNVSEVESKMQELFKKLKSPLLTRLKITWPKNFEQVEVFPKKLNDLYMGHPLMVSAKVTTATELTNSSMDESTHSVLFEGQSGSTLWKSKLNWNSKNPHPGISRLWARNKIDALMDEYREQPPNASATWLADKKKALKQQIINLSIKHHIISRFTGFVAVSQQPLSTLSDSDSKTPSAKSLAKKVAMPQNTPHGWSGFKQNNTLNSYPQTATIAPSLELMGLVFILLSLFLWLWKQFKQHLDLLGAKI